MIAVSAHRAWIGRIVWFTALWAGGVGVIAAVAFTLRFLIH